MRRFIMAMIIIISFAICAAISAYAKGARAGGYIVGYPESEVGEPITYDIVEEIPARAQVGVAKEKNLMQIDNSNALEDEQIKSQAISKKDQLIRMLQEQVASKDKQLNILQERIERLNKIIERKENELFMMRPPESAQYKVRKGDNLWKIAARKEVYGDPYMWITIYNANPAQAEISLWL